MPKRTKNYHAWLVRRLAEPREAERYLKVAMADSPGMFLKALRNVAEANRMARVAEGAGVNRESLYKSLSEEGNPRFDTLNSVLDTLGIALTVKLKDSRIETNTPATTTITSIFAIASMAMPNVAAQVVTNEVKDYLLVPRINRDADIEVPQKEPARILQSVGTSEYGCAVA